MNYLFFALQRSSRLGGALENLFLRFWDRYLQKSNDKEILQVAAPFLVFRGLVMAHPIWYPNLADEARSILFRFMDAVLQAETFRPERIHDYCGTKD